MYVNPLQISLETLVGVAPMLGHRLEDRGRIRGAQDWALLQSWQTASTTPLRNADQQALFAVAPLDILVAERAGRKQFHLIEINGTGIGGLTNLTGDAVGSVLDCMCGMADRLAEPAPVILIASSGKESDEAPRLNRLLHEKVLYAEAVKRGLEYSGRNVSVTTLDQVVQGATPAGNDRALVVLGYIKDFLGHLQLREDGRLLLAGRPVSAAINDRFCLNVLHHFNHRVDLESLWTMNRCFLAGADKGVAYQLLNDYLARHPHPGFPDQVFFERVQDRPALIETVLRWMREGRKAVVKPQGTGLGHGIEFFLDPLESAEEIIERIDHSLSETEHFYRARGGAFPYTVCEYIDTCTIRNPRHALAGHKFEVRVVVYRDGMALKAFPAITKISSQTYDPRQPSHLSLINNITTSAQARKTEGVEFMLPLANRETLELLDISQDEMGEVCTLATRFIRFVLDQVQDAPERLGLPGGTRVPLSAASRPGAFVRMSA